MRPDTIRESYRATVSAYPDRGVITDLGFPATL